MSMRTLNWRFSYFEIEGAEDQSSTYYGCYGDTSENGLPVVSVLSRNMKMCMWTSTSLPTAKAGANSSAVYKAWRPWMFEKPNEL